MNTPPNQFEPNINENQYAGRNFSSIHQENDRGHQKFLSNLMNSISLNFQFILATLISAILIVAALLTDQSPIFILAVIVTPVFYSVIGFSIAFELGLFKFLKTSFFSFLTSSIIFILSGIFAGFIANQFPGTEFTRWKGFLEITWANVLLLAVGVIFLITIHIRNPKPKSLVANVALSYVLILPLSASGFALGYGQFDRFTKGVESFLILFGIAVLIGVLTLFISGIRPQLKKIWSPILLLFLVSIGLLSTVLNNRFFFQTRSTGVIEPVALSPNQENLPSPQSPTFTLPEPSKLPVESSKNEELVTFSSPTPVIPATNTPTITLTPLPTPVWAEVQAGEANGANVRADPGFSGKIIRSVLNGTLVEVLPDVTVVDNITWANIRFSDQTTGWIVRALLLSATPAPEW